MKRVITLVLVLCMVFPLTVFGQSKFEQPNINYEVKEYMNRLPKTEKEKIEGRINKPLLTNLSELSNENKKIVNETVIETENLAWAMVYEGKSVLIYETYDDDTFVSITDGYVEVISFQKDNIMTINDKDIAYELEITESKSLKQISHGGYEYSPLMSYVEISNPGGTWSYITTRNIDNTWAVVLIDIGIGAMTTFIMRNFFGYLPPKYSYAAGIAAGLISHVLASQTKSARFVQKEYEHDTRFKTYKYTERALAKGLDGIYYETGPWVSRYIAWAGL
ncbi:MAG: hypothetical protein GX114_05345 [Clostridiales bacterium]|nr:hypothetical protein [Clostridiales bacterium]